MLKVYLYPNIILDNAKSMNPYFKDLSNAILIHNKVINEGNPTRFGIFNILRYINDLDIVYLNWVEDLPDKRGGTIQSIFFMLLLPCLKLMGKKIVWTLHNKTSHSTKHQSMKKTLLRLLIKRCDLIITHASDGLNYIPEKIPVAFLPHPTKPCYKSVSNTDLKVYDIIIWGAVTEYKGIDTFLLYLIENRLISKYRILIAGRVDGPRLKESLESIAQENNNVTLLNRFIAEQELIDLIGKSRLILFSYHSKSVLSSGALMDSLRFKTTIVGPNVGAFNDLSKDGLIYTFHDYVHLIEVLDDLLENYQDRAISASLTETYIIENSWEMFSDRVTTQLNQL